MGSRPERPAYLGDGGPLALAHRGGGTRSLENTARAFEAAVRLGYRYIETDAWATADGTVVLFHDEDLSRVTDRTGRISELPHAEVARARVAGSEPIPVLEEVLHAWPDVRFNIDLKTDSVVDPFVDVVRRAGAQDRICVASFSDRRIARAAARFDRRVCLSAGPRAVARLKLASLTGLPLPSTGFRPDVLQIPTSAGPLPLVTPRLLETAHAAGIDVHVWTVNDPARMNTLLDLGVDGLISDETATLRDVLLRRGRW